MKRGLFTANITLVTSLLAACGNGGAYRLNMVDTCKGTTISVGEMEKQLRGASYRGPLDENHIPDSVRAYNDAACGGIVITCKGENMYWAQMDRILKSKEVNYDGPTNHTQAELDAYNRAACPRSGERKA